MAFCSFTGHTVVEFYYPKEIKWGCRKIFTLFVFSNKYFSTDEGDFTAGPPNRRVYLTVTAVPSLNNCSDCLQVATSYEEEGKTFMFLF